MSSELGWLSLRLEGPLQAWGFDSQYNRRNTGLFPTKSAIAGMCCAALGNRRGSEQEKETLGLFLKLRMMAIAIPKQCENRTLQLRRLEDFHTVQGTAKASGSVNNECHITRRSYLTDSAFGIVMTGDAAFLSDLAVAMRDPKWGVWLGRKTCIPSAPVLAGLFKTEQEAVRILIGGCNLELFDRQVEVEEFRDGKDTLADNAESFLSTDRLYSPRRVKTIMGLR